VSGQTRLQVQMQEARMLVPALFPLPLRPF